MKFEDMKIDSRLVKALHSVGIDRPTPIQEKAIAPARDKKDVLGIAPTGSGKTFAYLLPTLDWVLNAKIKHENTAVLILVPTRELVKQVDKFISVLANFTEVFTARVYAGPREGKQIRNIKGQVLDIVIATPGRLINFIEDEILDLSKISILILDEVDRLLDMGFLPDINKILQHIPHKNARQTLLFGSTLPPQVEALAMALQKRTEIVDLGRARNPDTIEHVAFETFEDDKFDVLIDLLHSPEIEKVLIFTQSRHEARITARNLRNAGLLDVEEIHGGLTQRQRDHALSNFRTGEVNVLVASDVAARGLDITNVTHVIHYDVPSDFNEYVHRAGRTGRAYSEGYSWLIVSPKEFANLANIENRMNKEMKRGREIRIKKQKK